MLRKWSKLSLIFLIILMYYSIIQLICSVSYMIIQNMGGLGGLYNIVGILGFVLLFAPFIIFVFRLGIQNSRNFFLTFLRKNLIFYLLYIIILFVIKNSIVLGDYSIDFSMINLYFELSKSAFSNFLMAYAYIFFDSISAILFFIFLPNYFLIVFNYCS